MADWHIDNVSVSGGFLAGLSVQLPPGLTCIIGPRGSGKSTLAEAIRYALLGSSGAAKSRLDLLQANLKGALVTLTTAADERGTAYVVRRSYQQSAAITTADGRPVTDVDVDRNTFLPLDAYGTAEIELIADESLGDKRRLLLDELIAVELRTVQLSLSECRRQLESNADAIRAGVRTVADIKEKIEEIGDARSRLAALPPPPPGAESAALLTASQQQQSNAREKQALAGTIATCAEWRRDIQAMLSTYTARLGAPNTVANSINQPITRRADEAVVTLLDRCRSYLTQADTELAAEESVIRFAQEELAKAHSQQLAEYEKLQAASATAGQAVRERAAREQEVAALTALEKQRSEADAKLVALQKEREALKAAYILEREKISQLRSRIAQDLQKHTGTKVRIRVLENADFLGYRQLLTDGLRGAGVRNHEDILAQLLCLRPEQIAQLIRDNDIDEFATQSNLGKERSSKILAAYRQNIDPFNLETVSIDDQIKIELNVSPHGEVHFKDASELSRGQKCTALLPLLLARRFTPLVIDQPEDNLDNHFIYETVVDSIRRIKENRQMLFITHNANIPVLGDADLVIVMNSDGKRGYIEKAGTLDECRSEIIDLLEGGEEAFELRKRRYGK